MKQAPVRALGEREDPIRILPLFFFSVETMNYPSLTFLTVLVLAIAIDIVLLVLLCREPRSGCTQACNQGRSCSCGNQEQETPCSGKP